MDRTKGVGRSGRKIVRRACIAAVAAAAACLLVLTAGSIVTQEPAAEAQQAPAQAAARTLAQSPAWGSEALQVARDRAFEWAPFPVANACGIGASSCFKCHNGTRAAAPAMDKKTTPWHPDHKVVNDSCVGCHGGNARIIKKEIAHTNMVKDPRTTPDACTHCHKSGDATALLKKYQQVASAGGK
jgi:hypothetical protein